ncbi:oxidoreductase [Patescibacteria group bacterium]|nr:MAG: oxidoreductase [Patescibacteria group bacterium]
MKRVLFVIVIVGLAVGIFLDYGGRQRPIETVSESVSSEIQPREVRPRAVQPRSEPALIPVTLQVLAGVYNKSLLGRKLKVPVGWSISVFASGLGKARMLARDDQGTIYVTGMDKGLVYALADQDEDGVADRNVVFKKGLRKPSGIFWHQGWLYIAEENRVIRVGPPDYKPQVIVRSLPAGGNHVTRTLAVLGGKLYVSVGSSCNVCKDNPRRAAVLEYNLDGSGERVYARGLRNAVGLIAGQDGKLWATDNGRDWLGDDLPPEEVNVVEEGKDYGWPYCYGDRVPDPEFGSPERCNTTEPPTVSFQAHSAPLGLRFLGDSWLGPYRGDLIVASHGSWNRNVPTGYKLIRMKQENGQWLVSDFVTGWRREGEEAWGRPVDVLEGKNGELFISDDLAGVVYLLRPPAGQS